MEQSREFTSKKRYVWALVIGTMIFLLVFAVSYSLSYFELQRVSNVQSDTSYSIFEDKLDHSLFNISLCNTSSFEKISQDLGFQGRIIDDLERKLGKLNENVLLRKKFYSLVEIEHFEFIKEFNKECKRQHNTILFFYSNNASEIETSEESGRVLGVVSNKYEKNLTIYSFDVDLDSDLVNKLQEKYNVSNSNAPAIVVNERVKIVNPSNIQEIEKYLMLF